MGMFKWFKIAKNKKKSLGHFGGPVVHRKKIRQIWAEWAVYITWYFRNDLGTFFCIFESLKHPYTKLWSRNLLNFFSFWATLANLGVWHHEISKYQWWVVLRNSFLKRHLLYICTYDYSFSWMEKLLHKTRAWILMQCRPKGHLLNISTPLFFM